MSVVQKAIIAIIIILIIIAIALVYLYKQSSKPISLPVTSKNMKITSPAFNTQEKIPTKYTCDGDGINPALNISEIPSEAKSLVLIADDPDAPSGTWIHWLVWNIKPDTSQIAENSVPEGSVEGRTSSGRPGYGPPCPPSGTHRYFFKIYALDTVLDIAASSKVNDLLEAIDGHVLDSAEIFGLYSRS